MPTCLHIFQKGLFFAVECWYEKKIIAKINPELQNQSEKEYFDVKASLQL